MKVVLFHPEIPQNTGNIGRLCVATQTELILVRPLGFKIDAKEIRRSGLDYWEFLKFSVVESLEEVYAQNPGARFWYLSTKGSQLYTEVAYEPTDILVFGPESIGLSAEILAEHQESIVKIPMWGPVRSLNLSTAVGVVVYEVYRQLKMS